MLKIEIWYHVVFLAFVRIIMTEASSIPTEHLQVALHIVRQLKWNQRIK